MHPNQVEYDKKSRAQKIEAGLVSVRVWVPIEKRSEIIEIAKQMRNEK